MQTCWNPYRKETWEKITRCCLSVRCCLFESNAVKTFFLAKSLTVTHLLGWFHSNHSLAIWFVTEQQDQSNSRFLLQAEMKDDKYFNIELELSYFLSSYHPGGARAIDTPQSAFVLDNCLLGGIGCFHIFLYISFQALFLFLSWGTSFPFLRGVSSLCLISSWCS